MADGSPDEVAFVVVAPVVGVKVALSVVAVWVVEVVFVFHSVSITAIGQNSKSYLCDLFHSRIGCASCIKTIY